MNYIYLFLPMICVYLSGSFFPISEQSSKDIPLRPPGWVFGVVWPILLLLIGYSWTLRPKMSYYYFTLTLLLSSWAFFYATNRLYAFLNILTTILFSIFLIFHKFNKKSSYLLLPLVAWLSFASYLAFNSI
jgi:benzodiazapine receptor